VFFAISLVVDEVLNSSAASACVHDLVDVPFLGAIFSNDGAWASWFSIGEKEWAVAAIAAIFLHDLLLSAHQTSCIRAVK
jgi:hypothetical protein